MAEQEYVTREEVIKLFNELLRQRDDLESRIRDYFLGVRDKEMFHAIKNLIDDERIDVILCIYRDDMTVAQTSTELGISERTVRRHKRRLLEQLAKLL